MPNIDFYGGYSYLFSSFHPTNTNLSASGMTGWDASLKFPLLGQFLGIKGDVSGVSHNGSPQFSPKSYFFLLGPQVGLHIHKSTVFLHGMVGSSHLSSSALPNVKSDTSFAVAVGGGFDFGIARYIAWRFTGDFYNTNYKATNQNVSEIKNSNGRISTGPVFRF